MPVPWIDISGVTALEWRDIRETFADGIKFNLALEVPVYPHWVYEIDTNTLLGKITAPLRVRGGPENGRIHCWTIGLADARYITSQSGDPDIIGAYQWSWQLTFDVWGFFDNDGTAASQQRAENEARLISAFLWRNSGLMVASIPQLRRVKPLTFTAIQPSPFSDGSSVIVATGTVQVEVSEAMTV